jgi:hypothetical protein
MRVSSPPIGDLARRKHAIYYGMMVSGIIIIIMWKGTKQTGALLIITTMMHI